MSKNELRSLQTKGRLVAAARALFARDGYAQTGTEAIIQAAGVTRGALYHHYRDKADLFEAVCHALAGEASQAIQNATKNVTNPSEALEKGCVAWIDYMIRPESRRILVMDAPGVLGRERWEALDRERSFDLLHTGITEAIEAAEVHFEAGPMVLAVLLNGAMNEIALRAEGDDVAALKTGLRALLRALEP